MPMTRILFWPAFLVTLCATLCSSQNAHQHAESADEGLGYVHLAITSTAMTQHQFDRAVAMLHSFWYEKADEAFARIVQDDAECAMGYWGIAMSHYHPLWEKPDAAALRAGRAALVKARSVGARTRREAAYIDALWQFYAEYETVDHLTRVLAYEGAMERLHRDYPGDTEGAAFYALSLIASALSLPSDKTYAREKRAALLLNDVLAHNPEHPGVTHYLIHTYDSPALASLALPAARSYARIAPAVPHALHMPSHIFTRLGLWQESISSNLASEAAAKDYAVKTNMDGPWDEQLHAMDYLMYAYLQAGEDGHARGVLEDVYRIQRTSPESFKAAYALAAVPARYAIERRQWKEADTLKPTPQSYAWNRFQPALALTYFARGMGAARSGDTSGARDDITMLEELREKLVRQNDRYWAGQVEIQIRSVSAWLAYATGNSNQAIALMKSAAALEDSTEKHPVTPGPILPAHEMLGDLLLQLNRPREALEEFTLSLGVAPDRFGALDGAVRAARLCGDRGRAKSFSERLLSVCSHADTDRPALQEARRAISEK